MNKSPKSANEILVLAKENHQKNNFKLAKSLYEELLRKDHKNSEGLFYFGTLCLQLREYEKSKELLNKAIKVNPNYVEAYNNLGNVLDQLGELENSKECFKKIIEIDPNNTHAYNNLGILHHKLKELEQAAKFCKKAIDIDSKFLEAYNNLGNILNELGDFQNSIKSYTKVIEINPNHTNAINNLSILFTRIQIKDLTKTNIIFFRKLFLFLYKRNDIDHSYIFSNAKLLIFTIYDLKKIDPDLKKIDLLKFQSIKDLIKDELFILMLKKSLMKDVFFEKILTKIRYEILVNLFKKKGEFLNKNSKFIFALSENCFFNEYIFITTNKEKNFLIKLKDLIKKSKEILELEIGILGSYIPIGSIESIKKKLERFESKNSEFNSLYKVQIIEVEEEKKISYSIKSLARISNDISDRVQKQYEENPYPRWRYVNKRNFMHSVDVINNQIRPNRIKFDDKLNRPNILIAGCGTGKHIFLSANYADSNILAIDISKSSIAYAKRKSNELGVSNLKFLHSDILDLKKLKKKFDIIECVGVIHHMKNPLDGLDVLYNLLEPHGYLKLGLYSDLARQDVIKIKEIVKKNKIKITKDEIRNFRKVILNKKDEKLLNWGDFYSMSSLRDLIFHVQEHRYNIPQISKILSKYNLEFLGFNDLDIKIRYSKIYKEDKKNTNLNNWNEFEMNNKDLFRGMYNFWVKKKIN